MDSRRNSKRTSCNFFKSSTKVGQKFKRKETVYTNSARRSKKSRFSSPSPEKHRSAKKASIEIKISDKVKDDIPVRTYGDFYCKACDSHMSSEQTFECHVQGKRHLRNTNRQGPSKESEYEFVDQDPIMLPEIKKIKKPIVGLQHCCEMLRSDGKPTYQCFLCSVSIPNSQLLIEHVIGLRHRLAYLKIHDSVNYTVITKADLKKGMIEPVVEEFIQKYQNKHGLGKMRVKVAKSISSSSYNSPGRPYKDDLIHKKNKNFGRNSYEDDDDDVRSESKSDSSDWKRSKNSYDDVRKVVSKSEDSDYKHLKMSYNDEEEDEDDVRNESKSEDYDYKHLKLSYNDEEDDEEEERNESVSENLEWRPSRISYEDFRKDFKTEDSNWRQVSGEDTDCHSTDHYDSELHHEKSVKEPEQFNQIEIVYSDRRSLTPSQNSNANYEDTETDMYSRLTWNVPDHSSQSEDLRVFLEKKRMLESVNTTPLPTVPNNANSLESVSSYIEEMPTMKFLELVLQKVEKLEDPSEGEVNMLSKIGKHMFKIVMKKKMGNLAPDLQEKYQSVTNEPVSQPTVVRTATPEQKTPSKYDFQSLMELIKNPRRESEKPVVNYTFPLQNISSQLGIASTSNHQPTYTTESLNFISNFLQTSSSIPTSSIRDFPSISGLTWSGSQGIPSVSPYSYPQNISHQSQVPKHNLWTTLQYKDNLNQY